MEQEALRKAAKARKQNLDVEGKGASAASHHHISIMSHRHSKNPRIRPKKNERKLRSSMNSFPEMILETLRFFSPEFMSFCSILLGQLSGWESD